MAEIPGDFTEDTFLGGQLRLRQPKSGHRAGHDAVLLAAATSAQPGDHVVDFGAGVGTAGLALAKRIAGVELIMVEIDESLAELARTNARANGISAKVIVLDIAASAAEYGNAGVAPDSVDGVMMNPPFNDPARHRPSPDVSRALAHTATTDTLDSWIHAARRILKSGGVLTLIWRADGLANVLAALDRGFGSLVMMPVHSEPSTPAIRILIRAIKGGRMPMTIHGGLMLNDQPGVPNKEVQKILRGQGALLMAAA